ncbi:MAG: nitroreductase family protein [Deltaproteobacteria bacterium]|nr:nitroreductase family protein [Deltaproteobacteria bacterium]
MNNMEWIKKLSDESKRNILSFIETNPDAPLKKYEAVLRDKDFNVFYNAPCLVYVGGSEKVRSLQVDCALAASYFMFSAAARGLGTCWVGLGTSIQDLEIRGQIGMPGDYRIVAPVVVMNDLVCDLIQRQRVDKRKGIDRKKCAHREAVAMIKELSLSSIS